jgi:hypothetical protein
MLSNGAMIGIGIVSDKNMLLLIYCLPLGLLALIVILNKDFKIVEKITLKFLGIEILMVGLCILIILMNDKIKTIVILITLLVSSSVIIL